MLSTVMNVIHVPIFFPVGDIDDADIFGDSESDDSHSMGVGFWL